MKRLMRWVLIGGTLLLPGLVHLGCSEPAQVQLTPCTLKGWGRIAECGQIRVPLVFDAPNGAQLKIHFARVRGRAIQKKAPPLFVMAGGPGQAATEYGRLLENAFRPTLGARDVILIDQRGTGQSHPMPCPLMSDFAYSKVTGAQLAERGQTCLEATTEQPQYFGSEAIINDVEAVREALGYSKIALWGGSFGTRLALRYLARFPDRVFALVLDGVSSNTVPLFALTPNYAQAAWDALVQRCQRDDRCAQAYPDLDQDLRTLLASPETVARVEDPIHGAVASATINSDLVAGVVRAALYSPQRASLLPLAVTRAARGDHQVMAALAGEASSMADSMYVGSSMTILCTEDLDRLTGRRGCGRRSNLRRSVLQVLAQHLYALAADPSSG